MRRIIPLLVAGALAATVTGPAEAEIFRWKDASGREHFTTDISRVPPEYRAKARQGAREGLGRVNVIDGSGGSGPAAHGSKPAASERRHFGVPANGAPQQPAPRRAFAPPAEAEKVGGHDEAWWRDRASSYRREIERLESAVDACEDVKAPSGYAASGRRLKRQHRERQMAAVNLCSRNRSNLDAKRLQYANFSERARKQGVPPGWLR